MDQMPLHLQPCLELSPLPGPCGNLAFVQDACSLVSPATLLHRGRRFAAPLLFPDHWLLEAGSTWPCSLIVDLHIHYRLQHLALSWPSISSPRSLPSCLWHHVCGKPIQTPSLSTPWPSQFQHPFPLSHFSHSAHPSDLSFALIFTAPASIVPIQCITSITLLQFSGPFVPLSFSFIFLTKSWLLGFPGAVVENPPANAGDMGLSPGLGRSHMPQSN